MVKTKGIILLFAILLLPVCVFADNTGTDWTLGAGGKYSYGGGTDALIGSDINVDSLSIIGSGQSFSITSGYLNFTSGANTGGWNWDGGGSLSISGCIDNVTTNCSQDLLTSNDFSSISIVPVLQLGKYSFDVEFGELSGDLSTAVASAFGLSPGFTATSLNLIFTYGSYGGSFNGTNLGGWIQTTNTPIAASDDASLAGGLALYALGALVLGLAWRFGFRKSVVQ